jgi:type I restriction enzyme M protein
VQQKRNEYLNNVGLWWKQNLAKLEALPQEKNVFELYRDFAESIALHFSALGILDLNKSRGAFATYWNTLETDLKSVAASGWNADLIPDAEILQSQYPEVLQELANNEARRDELEAQFAAVNETEDEAEEVEVDDSTSVLPKELVKEYKAAQKSLRSEVSNLKKELKALDMRIKATEQHGQLDFKEVSVAAEPSSQDLQYKRNSLLDSMTQKEQLLQEMEQKLENHTALELELKNCRAAIKEIKDKKADLVAKAREKISEAEAKDLILARWKIALHDTLMDYVNRYERDLLNILEQKYSKYETTLVKVLNEREEAANTLSNFLKELGYEA